MQLLAKFKKILYVGFRATLNFRKNFTVPFLKYKPLKLKLRVFAVGHSVTCTIITYCVTKIIPTCSPVIGQFFDTMIVASIDKEW